MSTTSPIVSAQDLFALPEDGRRYELVRGELRTMTPAGSGHGALGADLLLRLGRPVVDQQLGRLFNADTGFLIARSPDTVRSPDLAFVSNARLIDPLPEGFYPGPPDLAVEIVSPSDRTIAVDEKVQDWLRAGCQEVWIVRPRQRQVSVHRLGEDPRVLDATDILATPQLPGFSCGVAELMDK
jgi:Uma2 family endonuclease